MWATCASCGFKCFRRGSIFCRRSRHRFKKSRPTVGPRQSSQSVAAGRRGEHVPTWSQGSQKPQLATDSRPERKGTGGIPRSARIGFRRGSFGKRGRSVVRLTRLSQRGRSKTAFFPLTQNAFLRTEPMTTAPTVTTGRRAAGRLSRKHGCHWCRQHWSV